MEWSGVEWSEVKSSLWQEAVPTREGGDMNLGAEERAEVAEVRAEVEGLMLVLMLTLRLRRRPRLRNGFRRPS